jgi:hypothetical protein
LARAIDTKGLIRPAAVAIALVSGLQPAMAAVTLHCNPVADVDPAAATALCDAFADALATSQWANVQGVTLQLDINNLRPTAISVTLTATNAKGRTHTINRGLSASDTTITPTMQAAFLKKLLAAIPSDF